MNKITKTLGAALLAILPAGAPMADTMYWTFDNNLNRSVSFVLYSMDYGDEWPGGNQTYVLAPLEYDGAISIECEWGELICYGAWLRGAPHGDFWGVGPDAIYDCPGCCYTCGQQDAGPIPINW